MLRTVDVAEGLARQARMHIASAVRVLVVPADVLRDVEVRRRQRTPERLEVSSGCPPHRADRRTRRCRIRRSPEHCRRDGTGPCAACCTTRAWPGARTHPAFGLLASSAIEDRIRAPRQEELQLDVDWPDAPPNLRQVTRLAGAPVRALRRVERVGQVDEARRAEGRGRARAVEERKVVRQPVAKQIGDAAVGTGDGIPQCCQYCERYGRHRPRKGRSRLLHVNLPQKESPALLSRSSGPGWVTSLLSPLHRRSLWPRPPKPSTRSAPPSSTWP